MGKTFKRHHTSNHGCENYNNDKIISFIRLSNTSKKLILSSVDVNIQVLSLWKCKSVQWVGGQ